MEREVGGSLFEYCNYIVNVDFVRFKYVVLAKY
jgi:hypothetical protein